MKQKIIIIFLSVALLLSLATTLYSFSPVIVMEGRTHRNITCRADQFIIIQYSDTDIKVVCWRWE